VGRFRNASEIQKKLLREAWVSAVKNWSRKSMN
jgi:hypothetical protein